MYSVRYIVAIAGIVTMVGFGYSYFQKHGNNNDNNINGVDIMEIDKANFKLKKLRK